MRLPLVLAAIVVIAAACSSDTTPTETAAEAPTTSVVETTTSAAPSTSVSEPTTTAALTTTSTTTTTTTVAPCTRVTDFDDADWFIVNDGVMGGLSSAQGGLDDGVLSWTGTIVTRGGGFSSIRGPVDGQLDGAAELVLRIRTDGRSYELLADDAASNRVTHYNPIDADGGEWEEITVPLTGMEPRIFGNLVSSDPFDPDWAVQIGVILADGIDGDFSFEIDWIDACA